MSTTEGLRERTKNKKEEQRAGKTREGREARRPIKENTKERKNEKEKEIEETIKQIETEKRAISERYEKER